MKEEQFQDLVLQELRGINGRLGSLEAKVDNLETKVDALEVKVEELGVRLERVEHRQEEQHDMLEALLSNQKFANARIEQLKITTVDVEIIQKLATKDDLKASMQALSNRLFSQEVEVEKLKLVK